MGYSPWGNKESDTTERLHFDFLLPFIGSRVVSQSSATTQVKVKAGLGHQRLLCVLLAIPLRPLVRSVSFS